MKRLNFIIVLAVILNVSPSVAETTLIYNFNKPTFANISAPENIYEYNYFLGKGAENINNLGDNFFTRLLEGATLGLAIAEMDVVGHKYAHRDVAEHNGAEDTKVHIDFLGGRIKYIGSATSLQKLKRDATGFNWESTIVDYAIKRQLTKKVKLSSLLTYLVGQLNFPGYRFFSSDEPISESEYNDISSYCWNITSNQKKHDKTPSCSEKTACHCPCQKIRDKVFLDSEKAAWWNVIGALPAVRAGIVYLFTGDLPEMPNWWLNPQAELTDAGVMYVLSGWYKTKSGLTLHVRPGWGKNRVEDKDLFSLEAEISDIPLFKALTAEITGGVSETLEASCSIGGSVKIPVSKRQAVSLGANHYSGYHRKNPSAEGSWAEIIAQWHLKF